MVLTMTKKTISKTYKDVLNLHHDI